MFDAKTIEAIEPIAEKLDVPLPSLLAVVEVESGGRSFATVNGKTEPLIRFEGHYFDRFLSGDAKLMARAEGLANPQAGKIKNPRSQSGRWKLLSRAIKINRIAALSSVSWGVGQVMGSHWQWLGYGSVDALAREARSGLVGQISVMARYIDKSNLSHALRHQDWVAFARTYNGPAYRKNKYDEKMAAAYKRILKELEYDLPQPNGDDENQLRFGARGAEVKKLQRAMTARGYVLVADGLYGLKTDRLIRQFQRDHLLEETGVVGERETTLIFGGREMVSRQVNEKLCTLKSKLSASKKRVQSKMNGGAKSFRSKLRKGLLSISRRLA